MFAILVMMALFTTFLTTPILMAIYRPNRHLSSHKTSVGSRGDDDDLRILACIRGPGELPSLTALINSQCCSTTKVYMMRLLEMTHRSFSIATVQRTRRNGLPCIARFCHGEFDRQVAAAFEEKVKLRLRPATSVSTLPVMDKDICHIAEKKGAAMIILPFHKQWKREDGEDVEINLGQGWRGVNERVLANAPCSVALLVDRGFGLCSRGDERVRRVCIPFLGGPDSREALELGGRMADHPGMRITVVVFCGRARPDGENPSSSQVVEIEEQERDETSLAEFRRKWDGTVRFVEKGGSNIGKEVLGVAQSAEFELIVVGKGAAAAAAAEVGNEYEELGQMGGMLASCRHRIGTSVLVVQQRNSTNDAHSLT